MRKIRPTAPAILANLIARGSKLMPAPIRVNRPKPQVVNVKMMAMVSDGDPVSITVMDQPDETIEIIIKTTLAMKRKIVDVTILKLF